MEKEKSEEYQKLLKAVVNHIDGDIDVLDIIGKKGILRMVFKSIIIRNGKIKSSEMYKPFQNMYEGAWLQWQTKINQQVPAHPVNVSTLRLTAGRWMRYRMTMERIAKAIIPIT